MAAEQGLSAPLGEEAAAPALEPGQPPQGVTSPPQEGARLQGSVPPQEPLPEQAAEEGMATRLYHQEQSSVPFEPASSHATVTAPPRSSTKREVGGTEEDEAEATRTVGTS